jgi:glycosyltransferase involved in cell wall biosynthesis
MKYIIITPAKDEAEYIEKTLNSVIKQTVLPEEWIIVDDNSTDNTVEIVQRYRANYPWIKLLKKDVPEEKRLGGAKVVRAFNYGFNSISINNYDVVVKLDADLTLPPDYFKCVLNEFKADEKLGLCGGAIVNETQHGLVREKTASYHVRGAFKAYRLTAFISIGGLRVSFGWDGIDEFFLLEKGWKLKVLDELIVIHHRIMGTETGQNKYSFRMGKLCYHLGYGFLLTLFRAAKRAISVNPLIINGFFVVFGYFAGVFTEDELKLPKSTKKFIRHFQYRRIVNWEL